MHDIIFIGDSITKGTYTNTGENCPNSIAMPTFADVICQEAGFSDMVNYGVNGISYSSLSPIQTQFSLSLQCDGFDSAKNIVLAAGTNDFGTNVPLGTIEDCEDVSFCGAVEKVFRTLKNNNPHSVFFVLLPLNRWDKAVNDIGISLDEYRDVLRIKSKKFGFIIIDGKKIDISRRDITLDRVHPNNEGHREIAKFILAEAKQFFKY